jgi:hypothetical protein
MDNDRDPRGPMPHRTPAYSAHPAHPAHPAQPSLRVSSARVAPSWAIGPAALALLAGCDRPPVQRNCDSEAGVACPFLNEPSGRIEGTILYRGPAPLESPTRPGVASGRVVLLLFDYDNPPPPQGSATSAVSFQTLSAAQVFANAARNADGTVTATIPFQFPGVTRAGLYQLRAFYSRNESVRVERGGVAIEAPSGFHPLFSVRNLPVAGDVAGGALEDPSAPVPRFARIEVGQRVEENGRVRYVMPVDGAVTDHVTVYLGRTLPTERPMFRLVTRETTITRAGMDSTLPAPTRLTLQEVPAPPPNDPVTRAPRPGPELLRFAREWGLQPPGTEVLDMPRNPVIVETPLGANLPSLVARFSLDRDECFVAALAGVRVRRDCNSDPLADATQGFVQFAADVNENGAIDLTAAMGAPDAHPSLVSGSPFFAANNGRLPWIYPLVIVSRLHEPNAAERRLLLEGQSGRLSADALSRLRTALNRAETLDESDPNDKRYPVIFFGSVVPGGSSAGFLQPWTSGYRQVEQTSRIVLVPFGVEVRGPNRATDWHVIIPPQLPDTADRLAGALGAAGFRNVRCELFDPRYDDESQLTGLPEGRYAVNFIGPGGQSWTLPNELGGFPSPANAPEDLCPRNSQEDGAAGPQCRARSQSLFLRVRGVELPFVEARCPELPSG